MPSEDAPRQLFRRVEVLRAKKLHICDICGKPIPAGSQYLYSVQMTDVDTRPYVCKQHRGPCWENENGKD